MAAYPNMFETAGSKASALRVYDLNGSCQSEAGQVGGGVAARCQSIAGPMAYVCQRSSEKGVCMRVRTLRWLVAGVTLVAAAAVLAGSSLGAGGAYTVTPLASDQPGVAPTTDPKLVNAWGLTAGPMTPWWVADNATDLSTLYTGAGVKVPLEVAVAGGPTGDVFNPSAGFVVQSGHASGPARFIFATEAGTIRGWNPGVPPPPTSTQTEVGVDRSAAGAIYKGLAIAQTAHGTLLYGADFHNGRIDVFDGNWTPVATLGGFVDPKLPRHFAPFNVQTIGARIFVAYARQDEGAKGEVAGPGLGVVDVYDTAGTLLGRVATGGKLDAPWGLALAPAGQFGAFSGDLLIGNFGNGKINAYQQQADGSWIFAGTLNGANGHPLAIDGLWALQFGNAAAAGPSNKLFFTAGPDGETHGLFGSITAG
jgi:uncharacterized protein (TIGR03118 family)